VGIARNRVAAGVFAAAGVVGVVAGVIGIVLIHREILAVFGVNAERRVGLSFEIFHGLAREPLRRCDRFVGDDNLFLLGLRSLRNWRASAVSNERHADSRQAFRSAA